MDAKNDIQETSSAEPAAPPRQTSTKSVSLRLNPWWLSAALLICLIVCLLLWRPWERTAQTDRTITVIGSTTVKAEPDEFVFMPSYEFKHADKQTALDQSTAKSKEVIAALKALGVADKNIKSRTSGYNYDYWYDDEEKVYSYGFSPEVIVSTREMAQKVEDYLIKTEPMGVVSPETKFSRNKLRQLESKARSDATKDARVKADEMAKNIGFKVAKVKSIEDNGASDQWSDMRMTMTEHATAIDDEGLAVQPGEDELDYSITVIYYIR